MTQSPTFLIEDVQTDLPLSALSVRKLLQFLLKELHIKTHELSLRFVSSQEIAQLHADFFDDPTVTDCITFPIDPVGTSTSYHVLGEICICPSVAIVYAQEHSIDPYEEVSRYVIHGVLHLIGYDDIDRLDAQTMRSQEDRLLLLLQETNHLIKKKARPRNKNPA